MTLDSGPTAAGSPDRPEPADVPLSERPPTCGSEDCASAVDSRPRERARATDRRLRERAEVVRRRELATALARLEARGSLTDAQRDALAAMTERLVAGLLAPATDGLDAAAAADDPETVEALRRLFGE